MKNLLFLQKIEVCDGLTIIEGYNENENTFEYFANELNGKYFIFGVSAVNARFLESDLMALFHNGFFDRWIKD